MPPNVTDAELNAIKDNLLASLRYTDQVWEIHLQGRRILGYKGRLAFDSEAKAKASLTRRLNWIGDVHGVLTRLKKALGLPLPSYSDSEAIKKTVVDQWLKDGTIQFVRVQ